MKTVKVYKTNGIVELHVKGSSKVYGFSELEPEYWVSVAHKILDDRTSFGKYRLATAYFKENPEQTTLVAEVFAK